MQIPIIRASRRAVSCLSGAHSGTVHSVYRRTVNLRLHPSGPDGDPDCGCTAGAAVPQLIALQDADCVLSPLSLCTALSAAQLSSLPIKAGQAAAADADGIRITTPDGVIAFGLSAGGSARTSGEGAQDPAAHPALPLTTDLNLATHPALPLAADRLRALSVDISRVLSFSPSGSFARIFCSPVHDEDLTLNAAEGCISNAAASFRTGEASSAAETLCKGLIGLGGGLTPAGDDFLCGVLAGLYLSGLFTGPDRSAALPAFSRALQTAVCDHLSDTIDISAAFLCCACEGQFSETVAKLAADAAAGTADSRAIAASFSGIGHSSGFDTLAGIFFALQLQTP